DLGPDLATPVVEGVRERGAQIDVWRPARASAEAAAVEREGGGGAGSDALGIELGAHRYAREGDQRLQDLGHRHRLAGADVEDRRARPGELRREHVGR